MATVGVIPARYGSTRFPGKPLARLLGKPMIRWVYERASLCPGLDEVLVATDDQRILEEVAGFGGRGVLTSPDCPTGTDRVYEASRGLNFDVILNLQGDEPALDPSGVQALLGLMGDYPDLLMGTLVTPLRGRGDFTNPNVVKVALGEGGRCLYFSRSPIPYQRGFNPDEIGAWRHVGLYAFREEFLSAFASWPQGGLERAESLEQLRALERGVVIRAAQGPAPACAVDSPEDIPRAEEALRALGYAQ